VIIVPGGEGRGRSQIFARSPDSAALILRQGIGYGGQQIEVLDNPEPVFSFAGIFRSVRRHPRSRILLGSASDSAASLGLCFLLWGVLLRDADFDRANLWRVSALTGNGLSVEPLAKVRYLTTTEIQHVAATKVRPP
jgi:hypothetical protein